MQAFWAFTSIQIWPITTLAACQATLPGLARLSYITGPHIIIAGSTGRIRRLRDRVHSTHLGIPEALRTASYRAAFSCKSDCIQISHLCIGFNFSRNHLAFHSGERACRRFALIRGVFRTERRFDGRNGPEETENARGVNQYS